MPINVDFIDNSTGEIKENQVVWTAEELVHEKTKERERKERIKSYYGKVAEKTSYFKWLNSMKGDFVMLLYNANEALSFGISAANLTRLIYLSTYTSYNNNRLELPSSEIITKPIMEKLLLLSNDSFNNFYNEMLDKGILILQSDGSYSLSTECFMKGKLNNKQISKNRMQIYEKGVRELYVKAKPREHKRLSYLFQAIPYVNINNNIICFNPLESNTKSIKAMTIEDYCKKIGYDVNNSRRLKSDIIKLRLQNMPVFNFVKNCDGEFIFINPYVYYGGNKWEEVAVLGGFTTQTELDEEYQKILEIYNKRRNGES